MATISNCCIRAMHEVASMYVCESGMEQIHNALQCSVPCDSNCGFYFDLVVCHLFLLFVYLAHNTKVTHAYVKVP